MRIHPYTLILFGITIVIGILFVFIWVYLYHFYFKKQERKMANYSQRLFAFLFDMALFNAFAIVLGLTYMFFVGYSSSSSPEFVQEIIEHGTWAKVNIAFMHMVTSWGEYLNVLYEDGNLDRFWYHFRFLQCVLMGVYLVYEVVFESFLGMRATLGRRGMGNIVGNETDQSLGFFRVFVRSFVKFSLIIPVYLFGGFWALMALMITSYFVFRINKKGKVLHDFIVGSTVLKRDMVL